MFDGFSIGSNDLTQLVLGVDRDSEIVAHVFGICGQAPSESPERRFLVERGIDGISLNADAVAKTTLTITGAEGRRRTA